MIANYHTHPTRCRHARGPEREYVEAAIARGLQIFGFSDHTPQYFPGNYYSRMRMFPEELDDYCNDIRALQAEFAGRIEIPLGVEAEYYPATWKELVPRLQDAGVEYMILGQHWVGNEENESYCGAPTKDEKFLQRYCAQTICAMETGIFTYIAHPDLIHFTGSKECYMYHMRELCRSARDTQTPLELNLLGVREKRHYPNKTFWQIAAEEGCPVVLGIDAHTPESVSEISAEAAAMFLVEEFGLNLQQTVPLKAI